MRDPQTSPVSDTPLGRPLENSEIQLNARPIVGYVTSDPQDPEQLRAHVTFNKPSTPVDRTDTQKLATLNSITDDAMMTHVDIARKLDLPGEALRRRLDRWRLRNSGWQEALDRTGRKPRYIYRISAVRDLLREVIRKSSLNRPSK